MAHGTLYDHKMINAGGLFTELGSWTAWSDATRLCKHESTNPSRRSKVRTYCSGGLIAEWPCGEVALATERA